MEDKDVDEYDFFDTPVVPYAVLQDGEEVRINVRDTATMEQMAVRAIVARSADRLPKGPVARLNVFGRLGARIDDEWYIQVVCELEEEALATDHETAQSLDMEQSLKTAETFKESRYRKPKED